MKYQVWNGDCLELLHEHAPVKCIFADPPDNINLGYGEYDDKMSDSDYEAMLEKWIQAFVKKAEIVWLSFNSRWSAQVGEIVMGSIRRRRMYPTLPQLEYKECVQVFTFGQHNSHDLGNNHRPLWRIMRPGAKLYPESIKVPSWRERNGDKRAKPGGRVPGDVFDFASKSTSAVVESFLDTGEAEVSPGDVFDFPRVTGNSKQRCDWHPTQLHEELVERCIKLSTTDGDHVLDPFGGTGTTLRVCKKLGRPCTLIEIDKNYCQKIAEENDLKLNGGSWVSQKSAA